MRLLLLCLLSIFCLQLFAADTASQRKNFLYAEAAIKKGDLSTYYRLKPTLTQYSLYPYLQYAEILRLMQSSVPTEHVQRFLATYPHSALANQLQNHWLKNLAQQQQWALYQKFYKPSQDVGLQCYAIWAEYKVSQKTSVLAKATPLWTQGRSQPKECNALFAAWQKTPYFTTGEVWKRTQLAVDADQKILVTYLRGYLLQRQQTLVDTWLQVNQNPQLITSVTLFKTPDPFLQVVQVYGIKRLLKQNATQALAAWEKIKNQYPFTEQQRGQVAYAFAIQLATSHDPSAITWLDAVPNAQKDTPIYEWRVRYALRQQDWQNVIQYISQMPSALQQEPLWRYWQGRAYNALNQTQKAQPILQTLAKERNYHGMLASDLLNQAYSLNDAPYEVSTKIKTDVAQEPGILRAMELFALKRLGDARREWNITTAKFNEQQLHAASLLARSLDWYDRGILTATAAKDRNDLNVRFPLAYANAMKTSAQKNKIDVAWAFAIARQESAFLPDAQSPAGAMGLMQLLPSTAQLVSKQVGLTYNKNQLLVPEKNIVYGTAYLRDMLAKFNYNRQLASAAYNAGSTRVYRWLPAKPLPTDVWIETIPFKETRHYVQNVASYWVIYNDHLNIAGKRLNHQTSYISQ